MLSLFQLLFPLGKRKQLSISLVEKSTSPITVDKQQLLKLGLDQLDAVYSAFDYSKSDDIAGAICELKYQKNTTIVSLLTPFLAWTLQALPTPSSTFQLVPVPLHWLRKFTRTFNQSELLAKELSAKCNLPVHTCLRRTRYTGSQAKRNRKQRLTAMKCAFVTRGLVPENILLIDDVWTTGSTLNECARALKVAGAKQVIGLTVAYTELNTL